MSSLERPDDFEVRRAHLASMTDEALHARFWELVERIVAPLIEEARSHTSPAIERSVLLRMGFSSIECKQLVEQMQQRGLLGHGAGRLVLELAKSEGMAIRDAGEALLTGEHSGEHWQALDAIITGDTREQP
jgi:D-ornithine 4,5-aminomutase subunit alpha